MAKRTQTRTRVTRKQSGRKRSAKVTMMPLVVKSSPDDTQGIIHAAVDDSTGAPRAVIPVAVKDKKAVKRRTAVIPVAVKTLPQPRLVSRRTLRPEAENPADLRSAAIGIADELIEAERNMFRLGLQYLKAMTTQVAKTLIGRPMTRFEQEIQAAQFAAQTERTMRVTLSRAA